MDAFMKFCLKAIPWAIGSFLTALGMTYVVLYSSTTLSNRVVAQWTQPGDIPYDSFGSYSLSIIENTTCYFSTPYAHTYEIFIGRGTVAPSYGHSVQFSFHPDGGTDLETHIRNSKVEWIPEGVTFIAASGHRLFIPRAMFVGGR